MNPRDLPTHLLSQGQYTFTVEDAMSLLGNRRSSTLAALARLQRRVEVASLTRGLYVVVPPDYLGWHAPPADWFIDSLMGYLRRPYYVALLSAAALHGAAHQAPQMFQVMTDRSEFVRSKKIGRSRIRFYSNSFIDLDSTERAIVPTGYALVSTRETTVVDLVSRPRNSGGLSNVATILREIGELNAAELARIAVRRDRSVVRRVGWFVEHFGQSEELEALRQAARVDMGEPALLSPSQGRRGSLDKNWALRINAQVEPDV
jgi:predicted transcriptional regulator of viral defense system